MSKIKSVIRNNATLIGAILFTILLYAPTMGRGFIQDDFLHLHMARWNTLKEALYTTLGQPFYAPMAWFSYRIDWLLWGYNPFAFAATNLALHLLNIVLIYTFVLRLRRSRVAAGWAAWGFALMSPAIVWAVTMIAGRAHVLTAFFFLATMNCLLLCLQSQKNKLIYVLATLLFAASTLISKESGITITVVIIALLIHQRKLLSSKSNKIYVGIVLSILFLIIVPVYWYFRSHSGAMRPTMSCIGYGYCLSVWTFSGNLFQYILRTYGILAVVAIAGALPAIIRKKRPIFNSISVKDLMFSSSIFIIGIAPVLFLGFRTGTYTYLPGIGAALLLGFISRSPFERITPIGVSLESNKRLFTLSTAPLVITIIILTWITIVYSLQYVRWAEFNTKLLNQVTYYEPKFVPGSLIILNSSPKEAIINKNPETVDTPKNQINNDNSKENSFPPDGYWFPYALRVLYIDTRIWGKVTRESAIPAECFQTNVKCFRYSIDNNGNPVLTRESIVKANSESNIEKNALTP